MKTQTTIYGPADGFEANRPVRFQGTPEQAKANNKPPNFSYAYADGRCVTCDAGAWMAAAEYPCGEEPPREFWDGRI